MDTTGSASAPTQPLARAKTPRTPSQLELRLLVLIRASGFEEPVTEYPFAKHLGRRWRFDFAWPDRWLAVEVDGGAWVPGGGRHTRGAGFAADHDKFNRAALLGWRVLRFTSRHLADGSALAEIAEALRIR
jgi:very-short-patch-repair endonuclease